MPNKPVISTNATTGEEIRYSSFKAAGEAIGINPAQISMACVSGRNCHGFYWRKAGELA